MISRVAENCLWLARYAERAETTARTLDVHLSLYLDSGVHELEEWRPLVVVVGQEQAFLASHGADRIHDRDTVVEYLTWDRDNPMSIASSIYCARENARMTRETISLEMWEILNEMWLWLGAPRTRRGFESDPHSFYVELRNRCALLYGMRWGTMLHEQPFNFMRLGTALERAGQTARILDVKYHSLGPSQPGRESAEDAAQWLATLRSCSAVEPFFKRAAHELSGAAVADFLLFDRAFPRSVSHNLHMCQHVLDLIRPEATPTVGERSAAAFAELIEWIEGLTIEQIVAEGMHEALTWIVDSTMDVAEVLDADFINPLPVAPAVGAVGA